MVNALTPVSPPPAWVAGLMMNKSLRARGRESSGPFIKQGIWFPASRDSSFRGESEASEPGIQTRCAVLDSGFARRRPGMTAQAKKSRRFRRLLKLITGRRQTEWTGATRCPNRDDLSHIRESLIDR